MTRHSPGPWAYTEHSWSDTSICDDNGRQIAQLSIEDEATEDTQDELAAQASADARLMAAAPDLLASLIEMRDLFDLMCSFGLNPAEGHEGSPKANAEAAIAKALGEGV